MERKNDPPLSARLTALAGFVREGARLIDVGTDHAYLPVSLAVNHRISAARASDIAEGPLRRARAHIDAYGVGGVVSTMRTPGLAGAGDFAPTDIVIAGMGGEMIAAILAESDAVKDPLVRLILQPMTKMQNLRAYLGAAGCEILDEALILDGRRVYQAICASFSGRAYDLTPLEKEIGPVNLKRGGEPLTYLLTQKKKQLLRALSGKRKGGADCSYEEALLTELETYLSGERP